MGHAEKSADAAGHRFRAPLAYKARFSLLQHAVRHPQSNSLDVHPASPVSRRPGRGRAVNLSALKC